MIASVDPLGNRSSISYDNANRPVSMTNPLAFTSTSVFDPAGRLIASVDALGNINTNVYDAANRLDRKYQPAREHRDERVRRSQQVGGHRRSTGEQEFNPL